MTQSKSNAARAQKVGDARWPQAERANDAIGGEEGQDRRTAGLWARDNWEGKAGDLAWVLVAIPASGQARFWQRQPSQPVRICGDRSTNVSAARLIAGADSSVLQVPVPSMMCP